MGRMKDYGIWLQELDVGDPVIVRGGVVLVTHALRGSVWAAGDLYSRASGKCVVPRTDEDLSCPCLLMKPTEEEMTAYYGRVNLLVGWERTTSNVEDRIEQIEEAILMHGSHPLGVRMVAVLTRAIELMGVFLKHTEYEGEQDENRAECEGR